MQFITFVVACGVTFGAAGVPQLGEMRTEWLEVGELAQMPTVHNFHEMAACTPDIIGVHYNPGDQLYDVPSGPRWSRYRSLPRVKLSINGKPIDCEKCCWAPYEALRRMSVDGLEVESAVRLPFEALGVLHEVCFTNRLERSQSIALEMLVPGERQGNADKCHDKRTLGAVQDRLRFRVCRPSGYFAVYSRRACYDVCCLESEHRSGRNGGAEVRDGRW